MKPSEIEREVELTLTCLDRIQKAKAPSGFAEALLKRMIFLEEERKWLKRTKLALAAMIAFAVINGLLLARNNNGEEQYLKAIGTYYQLNGEL